jgi:hypothetical protein
MIKRILIFLAVAAAAALTSCHHHPLWWGSEGTPVEVAIHWEDELEGRQPAKGMRVHLFSLSDHPHYGKIDHPATGGPVHLAHGSCHFTVAYHYHASNIYFRNDTDMENIEAYFAPTTRTTYTRAFPEQYTVAAATADDFYVGINEEYTVAGLGEPSNGDIHVYPQSVLVTYNFLIKGVKNAGDITETRGAITGMSGTYLLTQLKAGTSATTLLFSARADGNNDRITGSFRTFGRLDEQIKDFTIEMIYPSDTGTGYISGTWDVSSQVDADAPVDNDPATYEIIIEDAEIEIPRAGSGGGGGFDIDVNDWPDQPVVVPL